MESEARGGRRAPALDSGAGGGNPPSMDPSPNVFMVSLLIAGTLVCLAPVDSQAQGPEPLFGEWELRPEPGTSDYARVRCIIGPVPDDGDTQRFRVAYDLIGIRGGVTHLEWTGSFDGEDHRVQGLDYVMTNAYSEVGVRTFRIVTKVEGRVQTTAETTVSEDGRTMTTLTRGRTASGEDVVTTARYARIR